MKVLVGSKNPIKLAATKAGFETVFTNETLGFEAFEAPSGISVQPMTDEETLTGAKNRVKYLREKYPEADFYAGLEGGIHIWDAIPYSFAWVAVASKDRISCSRTASFPLPQEVMKLIKEGKELGEAMDVATNRTNTKQQEGAVGIFTNNLITRSELYQPAVILALVPFLHPKLTF
jgi:inosine/xanthosine triphosphatase